jgi:hypothetical protein
MKVYKNNLVLFFKDLLIANYPITDLKTYERYKEQGNLLILESLKANIPIKSQIYTYFLFCNQILRRKKEGLDIVSDYQMLLNCIFALIKLKILEEEDSVLIIGKKNLNII